MKGMFKYVFWWEFVSMNDVGVVMMDCVCLMFIEIVNDIVILVFVICF